MFQFNFLSESQGKRTLFYVKQVHPKAMHCPHCGIIGSMFLFSTKPAGAAQWRPSMLWHFRRPEFLPLILGDHGSHPQNSGQLLPTGYYQTLSPTAFSGCSARLNFNGAMPSSTRAASIQFKAAQTWTPIIGTHLIKWKLGIIIQFLSSLALYTLRLGK